MNQVERKRIDDAERWVAVQGGQEWRVGAPSDVPARRGWSDAARTGRAADEPRAVQAVAIQPRSGGPARHGRSAVVRRGAAGERRPGAATGARRPGAARPERCGPGRRPERGGPARRPGAAPTALAAGLLAARWHDPGCPGPWLLAAAKLGLATAQEETRGEREAERETSGGE